MPTLENLTKPILNPYGTLYSVVIGIDIDIDAREKYRYLSIVESRYFPITTSCIAKVIFGHELRLPCDLEFGTSPDKSIPVIEFVAEMNNHLRGSYKILKNQLRSPFTK